MGKNESYSELLKDTRWQRRRLEIMQRDDFTCQICGHSDKQLHVHHTLYDSDRSPWEYNDDELITLCADCHNEEHDSRRKIHETIDALNRRGLFMIEIEAILQSADILVNGMKRTDGVLYMIGGKSDLPEEEKQDFWGLDCPNDLCERLADWRNKIVKHV